MKQGTSLFFFVATLLLVGCSIDNDYDLDKDIDLTMALGSNGLALPMGVTQKMYLRDLLQVEQNDMLDTLTTGLYYLTKGGTMEAFIDIPPIEPFNIASVDAKTNSVFTAEGEIHSAFTTQERVGVGFEDLNIQIVDIDDDIKELHTAKLTNTTLTLTCAADDPRFTIKTGRDVIVTFPAFMHSSALNERNEYEVNMNVTEIVIPIDSITFPKEGTYGTIVKDGTITIKDDVYVEGYFTLSSIGSVDMQAGDSVCIKAHIDFSAATVTEIAGLVDPEIDVATDVLEIGDDLPAFLQDDEVSLNVGNPTLKFDIHGEDLPFPIRFSGEAIAQKGGTILASAPFPATGKVAVAMGANTCCYFCGEDVPFDPVAITPAATINQVPSLKNIIKKIPERIEIGFGDRRIQADGAYEHRIVFGDPYYAQADYKVYIPLTFDAGLCIVYTDTIADLNEDLKNYQAQGMTLTATARNTVPLELLIDILALDSEGQAIPEITSNLTKIEAASSHAATLVESDFSITLTAAQPAAISKIDKLVFRLKGSSSTLAANEALLSSQWIQLGNLKLRLNGQVVADFN